MSSRPSRRASYWTDKAKANLEKLKKLKESGKKRIDEVDEEDAGDVAAVYDDVCSNF